MASSPCTSSGKKSHKYKASPSQEPESLLTSLNVEGRSLRLTKSRLNDLNKRKECKNLKKDSRHSKSKKTKIISATATDAGSNSAHLINSQSSNSKIGNGQLTGNNETESVGMPQLTLMHSNGLIPSLKRRAVDSPANNEASLLPPTLFKIPKIIVSNNPKIFKQFPSSIGNFKIPRLSNKNGSNGNVENDNNMSSSSSSIGHDSDTTIINAATAPAVASVIPAPAVDSVIPDPAIAAVIPAPPATIDESEPGGEGDTIVQEYDENDDDLDVLVLTISPQELATDRWMFV